MKKYIFALILCFISCKKTDTYEDKISNKLESLDNFSFQNYSFVIIIPGSGCTGCISEAESFFHENIDNENVFFIFTKINSVKNLRLRFGNLLDRINVLVDQKDSFYIRDTNTSIYPVIIYIQNKGNLKYDFFDSGVDMQLPK